MRQFFTRKMAHPTTATAPIQTFCEERECVCVGGGGCEGRGWTDKIAVIFKWRVWQLKLSSSPSYPAPLLLQLTFGTGDRYVVSATAEVSGRTGDLGGRHGGFWAVVACLARTAGCRQVLLPAVITCSVKYSTCQNTRQHYTNVLHLRMPKYWGAWEIPAGAKAKTIKDKQTNKIAKKKDNL